MRASSRNVARLTRPRSRPRETNFPVWQLVKISEFKIILVTPEILKDGELIDTILSLTEKSQLDRIVFDETHPIVSWGSTFQPVYKQVCERIARLKSCPELLLSATVPAKLEKAIGGTFDNPTVHRSSVF